MKYSDMTWLIDTVEFDKIALTEYSVGIVSNGLMISGSTHVDAFLFARKFEFQAGVENVHYYNSFNAPTFELELFYDVLCEHYDTDRYMFCIKTRTHDEHDCVHYVYDGKLYVEYYY